MKSDEKGFLSLQRLPGRLNAEQTSSLLGFQVHDIPELARRGLLKPLGSPAPNAVKYFSATEVEEHARDTKWLGKATAAIYAHWQKANDKRRMPNPGSKLVEHQVAA